MLMTSTEPVWTEVVEKKTPKKPKNEETKTWRGDIDGESVFGKVVEFKEVTTKDGRQTHVLTLENDVFNETYTIWANAMLTRKLEAAGAEPGKMVKVEFVGMLPLSSDPTRTFRAYKVYVAEAQ